MAGASGEQVDMATNQIQYWRKRRKISLGQLSARIEAGGRNYASARTINRWEKGEARLPEWAAPEIAHVLRISEEELLYGPRTLSQRSR
jgi:transcriptional regulator with XRE-family HTH domain